MKTGSVQACDTFAAQALSVLVVLFGGGLKTSKGLAHARCDNSGFMTSIFRPIAGRTAQRAVAEMGYENMTPIQAQAIPVVLTGKDVMGAAQTGTGKTAAFAAAARSACSNTKTARPRRARHPVRALVLLPTRELADQVAQQIAQYAKYTKAAQHRRVWWHGHEAADHRAEKGVEVLVATPGACSTISRPRTPCSTRSSTWCSTRPTACSTSAFCPTCSASCPTCPKQRTTLLFSPPSRPRSSAWPAATRRDPITIEVARPNETASTVEQRFYSGDDDKRRAIRQVPRPAAHAGLSFSSTASSAAPAGAQPGARRPENRGAARR